MTSIEKSKEDARNLNELTDHLIKLIESDDKRFSFEFCAGGTMEIYDKEKEIGYAVHVAPIEYDEDGNAINLQQPQGSQENKYLAAYFITRRNTEC